MIKNLFINIIMEHFRVVLVNNLNNCNLNHESFKWVKNVLLKKLNCQRYNEYVNQNNKIRVHFMI